MTTHKDQKKNEIKRRDFLKVVGAGGTAAMLAACSQPTEAPVETSVPEVTEKVEVAMPLKGQKIKVLLSDFAFSRFMVDKKSEFTDKTGVEVEIENVTFPILLEQSEIELSAGSANYDVMWQVFIKAQRWMRAGWSTPLDDYITKSNFDMSDFIPSTIDAMVWEGVTYGIPFYAESTEMIYRKDKLDEAGLSFPKTFDELEVALKAIHDPEEFYGWVMRTQPNGIHFPAPIWIQGYGGNIFRDPPNDVTPTLNTPEALAGIEDLTSKIMKYSIAGSQIYGTPDCQNVMAQGQAGFWVDAMGLFFPITDPESSKVADKVEITLPPGGPGGQFPQIATHGLQIPNGSKQKEAAWEYIAWITSKEFMFRAMEDVGFKALNRKSILTSPEYAAKFDTGDTNIGQLIIDSLDLSKCEYRVLPEFPEVGQRLGQAIGEIISEQKTVQEAMDTCQADCEQIMIQGGNEISP